MLNELTLQNIEPLRLSAPYRPRLLDETLAQSLRSIGAVLIQGPRGCGKRTSARRLAKSAHVVTAADALPAPTTLPVTHEPPPILAGETPRLLIEWQRVPDLWDEIRIEVDRRSAFGQFILTASAEPTVEPFHTGTGRIARRTMRPMTLFESGYSTGSVRLSAVLQGEGLRSPETAHSKKPLSLDDIAILLCRGGWPRSLDLPDETAIRYARDHLDVILREDLTTLGGVSPDSALVRKFLGACTRRIGLPSADIELATEAGLAANRRASHEALRTIRLLRRTFLLEPLPVRGTFNIDASICAFSDPSVACAALGLGPEDLLRDRTVFSRLFVNLCLRDLRTYAESLRATVSGLSADDETSSDRSAHNPTVMIEGRGPMFPVGLVGFALEAELGNDDAAAALEAAATHLHRQAARYRTPPVFLMVLTGTGAGSYRREDGVFVVPIGYLKP